MPTSNDLSPLLKDLLYAADHRLLEDAVGQSISRTVGAGVADDFISGLLTDRVRKHKLAQAFAGPFRLPHLTQGGLILGKDASGRPLRMPLQYLNAHCLAVGSSGSGKTMRSLWMALQIAPQVRGCWLIDLRKAEFAQLAPYLERIGVELLIVPGRELRINPLQVPLGVAPIDWASRAADLLVHVLGLPERASKLLHLSVLELYRTFGVLDGNRHYPTLFDLRKTVANADDANHQAKLAVIDSIDPVLMSLGPEVLAYRVGWSSNDLAQRRIAFEFGGLAEVDKDLLLNTLVLSELASRVARGVSNPLMDLWVCCDEAARLVAPSNHAINIADLVGLVRGAGIGLDLSLQTSDIAPAVLSNCATKLVARCGSASDYETIGAAIGLTSEQKRWMALHLTPGMFIGQLGEGNWRHPFICRSPMLRLPALHPDSNRPLEISQSLPQLPAPSYSPEERS